MERQRFRLQDQILVIIDKREKSGNSRRLWVRAKENGKVEKHQDLATVVQKHMGSNEIRLC